MKNKKKVLGRGLSAILESPDTDITSSDISGNYVVGAVANIEIEKIEPNPFQPRNLFNEDSLNELAESIKTQGIIQPLTIRKLGFDKYQLISGERRLRAAKIAELIDVPCFIRVANDEQMLEMALVENIHREDLNSIEIAISYQRLIEECQLTQDELSKRIGKNRSTIANYLRLLKLPAEIQIALRDNTISMSHARAIINIEGKKNQINILKKIIKNNLSVRQVEDIVRNLEEQPISEIKQTKREELPLKYKNFKADFINKNNHRLNIKRNEKGKGRLMIYFKSDEELDKIISFFEE